MTRSRIHAPHLLSGLLLVAGCFAAGMARADPYAVFIDCGARWDFCVQACDYSVPGGPVRGKCYDYCSKDAGVCEASRIPVPASYRHHSRYSTDRR